MDRRALLALAPPALLGLAAAGCGPKRRPAPQPPQAPAPAPAPAAAPLPAKPTEGRLITGHYAALGLGGTRVEEPLAPPGMWASDGGVWFWWPDYLASANGTFWRVTAEVLSTLPRWEHDGPALPYPPGPKAGTRVVLIPGPSFAVGSLLAAGYFCPKAWDGDDVIFLGLTDGATRAAVPPGHAYRLYCPAAGHELAHQATGQLREPGQ